MPYPYNNTSNNNLQQQIQDLTRQFQQLNTQAVPYQPIMMPQPQPIAVYDYLHEKFIDEAKEVKMLQQMYKEK